MSTACAVEMKALSGWSRPLLTDSAPATSATSPLSNGVCVLSVFSASYSAWAWSPLIAATSSGSSHCISSPSGPKSFCIASISPGPANASVTQNGVVLCGTSRSGVFAVGSASQKLDPGFRGATIPVTSRVILASLPVAATSGPTIRSFEPGRSLNVRAVCWDTAT